MEEIKRPSPDALLTRIIAEESKKKRGRFRLFFGMAAGVGKTYEMLKQAQEQKQDGIAVWIGIVETHDRAETKNLIEGIPVIPRKKVEYRGTVLEEMDLDAILEKKPQLVLVDELAHTNVPGSRHEKRYQDVVEILEAGIDVYSTMNVQHLESRADVVHLITAVDIRETVPDSILDLVDSIELIDITPQELIERLKEGKIYPGRKTEQALQYFFQEGNLSALREIALRVMADKVERDMRDSRSPKASALSGSQPEKLLVAIGHSPFSERLIRTARRIVEDLEMPWVVIHVDTGKVLSVTDQNQLVKNLDLAEEMGAETVTLHGTQIAKTVSEYAQGQNVVQMIVGRPSQKAKWWHFSSSSRFVEHLIRRNPRIDITVLQQPEDFSKKKNEKASFEWDFQPSSYLKAIFWVLLTALVNHYLHPYIGYRAVGFSFLLVIVLLSVFLPFPAVLTAAALSTFIWQYTFVSLRESWALNNPQDVMIFVVYEDIMMFMAFFVVASASGFLTFQIKRNQKILKEREEKTRALYEILKSMTLVQGTEPIVNLALSKIENIFKAETCVLMAHNQQLSYTPDFGKLQLTTNDHAVAAWSFSHGRMAGWSTDTLPSSRVLCIALKSGEEKLGVLVFKPKTDKKLNPDQENLLISITNQVGVVFAKQRHDEETHETNLRRESEKLHPTLLNRVSDELRAPLATIIQTAKTLQSETQHHESNAKIRSLSDEILSTSEKLNQILENLPNITRPVDQGHL